jgi:hypothetical protein
MADPPLSSEADEATGVRPGGGPTTGMPRWVKVSLIIAIVLVLVLVVSFLAGVGHGPGLHTPPVEHGP